MRLLLPRGSFSSDIIPPERASGKCLFSRAEPNNQRKIRKKLVNRRIAFRLKMGYTDRDSRESKPKEPLNQSAAALSGSFVPTDWFENLEIRKGFLRFPNLNLEQNPSLTALAIESELPQHNHYVRNARPFRLFFGSTARFGRQRRRNCAALPLFFRSKKPRDVPQTAGRAPPGGGVCGAFDFSSHCSFLKLKIYEILTKIIFAGLFF